MTSVKNYLSERLTQVRQRWATGRLAAKVDIDVELQDLRDITTLTNELLPLIADQVVRMRTIPINGDGHNSALGKVLKLLADIGGPLVAEAIASAEQDIKRQRAELQDRLDAENARRREQVQ